MKKIVLIAAIVFFNIGCEEKMAENKKELKVEFNQELAGELARMYEVDQIAAGMPQGQFRELSREEWQAYKDSVFTTHQKRLDEMLDEFGYPGFDRVGNSGSQHFWVMVQHSDHDPEFQKRVLEVLKTEIDNENADPRNFAYLTDRVNKNTGKPLIYGTQVGFNNDTCRSFPINLADSANVNERRSAVGLPPLEEYLDEMTELNYEFNKEHCVSQGIEEPPLYKKTI